MKILIVSRWFPYPANNGSKIRILNLVKQLANVGEVSLVSFGEQDDVDNADGQWALRRWCERVEVVPYRPFRPNSVRAYAALPAPQPRFLVDTYDPRLAAAIDAVRREVRPDVATLTELDMVPYADDLPGLPLVLDDLEVSVHLDACRDGSVAGQLRAQLTWLKLTAYLRRMLPRFETCTVVSERERANLRRIVPDYDRVQVVPNSIDLESYAGTFGEPEPNTLVFAGALTYHANLDAARFFVSEVYPLVRQAVPDVRLRITGRTDGVDLGSLPSQPGVQLTGYVPDVRPVVARSWASVVPLRVGGGTRVKILESMALGTPVVSTSKGAEGLDVSDGADILLADAPSRLAARTVELLRSPLLRRRLASGGRALVESRYDSAVTGERLQALVERAARRGRFRPMKVAA